MVVEYPSGAVGSATSFFTVTPRLIFKCTGSAVPHVLPQVTISCGLAVLAYYYEDDIAKMREGKSLDITALGFLLAFLLVFKTQTAYRQFWTALSQVDGIRATNRILARAACSLFGNEEDVTFTRRFLRYQVLYFLVITEHFQSTGGDGDSTPSEVEFEKKLKEQIRGFATKEELACIYGDEGMNGPGNPAVVLYLMQLILKEGLERGLVKPPVVLAVMVNGISTLEKHFWTMDKIDKLQFPLPYAQVVKILVVVYVFMFPFVSVATSGIAAVPITFMVGLGFFGLDEVAEVLESPFSTDPNAIQLDEFIPIMIRDLDVMLECHKELKEVATCDGEEEMTLTARLHKCRSAEDIDSAYRKSMGMSLSRQPTVGPSALHLSDPKSDHDAWASSAA
jgi:putative membrane protein